MGDWTAPGPGPRSFFFPALGDDVDLKSNIEPNSENRGGGFVLGAEEQDLSEDNDEEGRIQACLAFDQSNKASVFPEGNMSSGGGLRERMAARAGFNAPRLNTESIRSADISSNTQVRSPYLAISPGLSPTTLLDSPVFLSNSLVQPSPTTGKFHFASSGNNSDPAWVSNAPDKKTDNCFEDINKSSFAFKPIVESSNPLFTVGKSKVPALPENSSLLQAVEPAKHPSESETELNIQADFSSSSYQKNTGVKNISSELKVFNTDGGFEYSLPVHDQKEEDMDHRGGGDSNVGGAPSEDGYNWRKYGQKQVKGSEFPRSYYKCTHPNCMVKKKVERSHEGHITEIIYKGTHSHPKPLPNRRSALGSSNPPSDMQVDIPEHDKPNNESFWTNMQRGAAVGARDSSHDTLEVTSSATFGNEYNNASVSLQAQNGAQFDSGDGIDGASAFSFDEDDDDRATHGSVSLGYDGEEDESESKRMKIEGYSADMSGTSRAIREPRVVVQTTSEVDILDDGYRWRKYGQKVVKGNPNPRSYYKCTSAGCSVRKHVERASHDLKSVITTYEGKHNHDVPAPRNSSHISSSVSNTLSTQAAGVQTHVHRPEPLQVHNSLARFDRSSTLGPFGLSGRPQVGPSHGFAFGMNQPGLLNLPMVGLNPNQGKMHILPVHQYLNQPRPVNDMGFMLPKEPKVEHVSERNMNSQNGRFSFGPQM